MEVKHKLRIYDSATKGNYIILHGKRYYLNEFIKNEDDTATLTLSNCHYLVITSIWYGHYNNYVRLTEGVI